MYHDSLRNYSPGLPFVKKREKMSSQSISGLGLSRREMRKNYKYLVKSLLTDAEKEFLYRCGKKYQRTPYIEIFCQELAQIINTQNKLRLLPYIRTIISEFDKYEYDKFVSRLKFKMMEVRTDFSTRPPDVYSLSPSVRSSVPRGKSDIRVLVIPHRDENLGFSIRGGSENGLGIFVSEVDTGSAAAGAGLEVGDQILEANNISLENVACSSAVRVLSVTDRLKLIIKRVGKIPEWKLAKEKVLWYDVHSGEIIAGPPSDIDLYHISGLDRQGLREKRVAITTSNSTDFIGFNIRGGNEYGLGIFVSRVDPGGLAEKNGICAGDQILDVNGHDFCKISHSAAADFLRTNEHLVITLREVGRYPAFKELFAEYTWSEKTRTHTPAAGTGRLPYADSPVSSRQNTIRSHKAKSLNNLYMGPGQGTPLQSDLIYLPKESNNSDAMYQPIDRQHSQGFAVYEFSGNKDPTHQEEIEVEIKDDYDGNDVEIVRMTENEVVNATDSRKLKQHHERKVFPSTSKAIYSHGLADHYESRPASRRNMMDDTHGMREHHMQSHSSPKVAHHVTTSHNSSLSTYQTQAMRNELRTEEVVNVRSSNKSPVNFEEYIIPKDNLPVMATGQNHVTTSRASYLQRQPHGIDYTDGSDTVIITEVDMSDRPQPRHSEVTKIQKTEIKATRQAPREAIPVNEREATDGSITPEEREALHLLDDQILMLESRKTQLSNREMAQINKEKESSANKGTWSKIKTRLKESIRLSPPDSPNPEYRNARPPLQTQASVDPAKLTVLDERCREMLPDHEHQEVMKQVLAYHQSKDLDTLVKNLLATLNTPERMLLLKDVRGIIYPYHTARFDNMVNYYEIEKYDDMSTKLHLPLRHNEPKPKKQLMTTVLDENGHFHIRTVNQHEKDVKTTTKVLSTLRSVSIEGPSEPKPIAPPTTEQIQWVKLNHVEDHSRRHTIRQIFNNIDDIPDPNTTIVTLSKQKQNLGLQLRGGRVGQVNLPVRIDEVLPDGAAAECDTLEVGVILVAVDGQKVVRCTCTEAEGILKDSYDNKDKQTMKLEIKLDKELKV